MYLGKLWRGGDGGDMMKKKTTHTPDWKKEPANSWIRPVRSCSCAKSRV